MSEFTERRHARRRAAGTAVALAALLGTCATTQAATTGGLELRLDTTLGADAPRGADSRTETLLRFGAADLNRRIEQVRSETDELRQRGDDLATVLARQEAMIERLRTLSGHQDQALEGLRSTIRSRAARAAGPASTPAPGPIAPSLGSPAGPPAAAAPAAEPPGGAPASTVATTVVTAPATSRPAPAPARAAAGGIGALGWEIWAGIGGAFLLIVSGVVIAARRRRASAPATSRIPSAPARPSPQETVATPAPASEAHAKVRAGSVGTPPGATVVPLRPSGQRGAKQERESKEPAPRARENEAGPASGADTLVEDRPADLTGGSAGKAAVARPADTRESGSGTFVLGPAAELGARVSEDVTTQGSGTIVQMGAGTLDGSGTIAEDLALGSGTIVEDGFGTLVEDAHAGSGTVADDGVGSRTVAHSSKGEQEPAVEPSTDAARKGADPAVLKEVDTLIAFEQFDKAKAVLDGMLDQDPENPEYLLRHYHVRTHGGMDTCTDDELMLRAMMDGPLSDTLLRVRDIGRGLMPGDPLFNDGAQRDAAVQVLGPRKTPADSAAPGESASQATSPAHATQADELPSDAGGAASEAKVEADGEPGDATSDAVDGDDKEAASLRLVPMD